MNIAQQLVQSEVNRLTTEIRTLEYTIGNVQKQLDQLKGRKQAAQAELDAKQEELDNWEV